jgi:hypothetical protein
MSFMVSGAKFVSIYPWAYHEELACNVESMPR